MRSLHKLLAAALVLGLILSACGGGSDSGGTTASTDADGNKVSAMPPVNTETPVSGNKIVYGLAAESNGWDPTTSQWGPWGLTVARTFFDTLTVFDEDGEIHPYLAESFTPNEDYTSWVIKLRPGVTFHNGEELTADVLKANWDSYSASPLVGRIFEEIESTSVVSELEMRADLVSPWVNFPKAWTTQIGVVQATESLEADSSTRAQNPIGTGPFEFEEWIPDQKLRVVANENYWQEGMPYLDEIEFRPISDPTSRSQALQSGDIDIAGLEEISQLNQFDGNDEFVIWKDPTAETAESFVMLNTLEPPFDDLSVRQALAYATDRATINEVLNDGERELANGPYRPSSPWFAEVDYPQYDPAKAQELIAAYEAENGPIEVTIEVGAGGALGAQTAQLIQEQWGTAGVDVELGSTEVASLIAKIITGDYQGVVWRQFDSPHPLQETVWWHQEGATDPGQIGLNFARNRNSELSDALDTSRTVETQEDEKAQFDIAQQQLAADVPYVWITHVEPAVVASTEVVNVFHATVPGTDKRMMSLHNSAHPLHQVWLSNGQ